jgi:hypothetical protein
MPGEGFYSSRDKDGLRSKSWRLKHQPKIVRTIREDVTTTNEEDAGYISLQPARKRRRLDEDTDSSEEDDTPAYRAIERKAGGKQSQGSDTSDDEEEGITPAIDQRNPLQWRSIQLNRQVKDHPEDIKAWLELVNHQDVLLRAGEDMDHQVLEHEVHSFTEIKVSMLESALLHATIPTDRVLILNRLMQEGCKVWNSKTALKKWEQVRKDEDDNFTLWITHLNYCMTDIASFRYDAVKEMLLDKLRQVLSRSASGPLQNVLQEAIYIFLRMTRFMHDAGFKELAVGAWQAMLELTFFRPSGVESKDSAMADFRDFWESEVPRIGEPGALGWNRYSEAGGEDPELQSAVDADAEAEPSRDAYESWANVERLQADKARMPARTMDEDNQDDPFRVVMYSDIEPLLFYIPGQELPLVQDQLLNGFLLFSGFPPFSQSNEWTQEACEDQFIMAARGSVESQTLPTPNVDDVDEPQRNNIAFAPISMHVAISADVHFPGPKWFRYLNEEAPHRALDAHWVHTTTQQLTFGAGVEELSIYQLALGLLDGEAGVKKLAKSLLKRYPSSLGLYNAYALAEFAGGHTDMAKRVLYSAVKLTTVRRPIPSVRSGLTWTNANCVLRIIQNDNGIFLWRTWSWIELELGNKWLAIKRLCSSVDTTIREAQDDDSAVPSTYILMADQAFKSNVHSSLSLGDINTAATWGECLGLLSYLVAEKPDEPMSSLQGNISAAMNSINWVCSELRSRGGASTTAHEGLLQFAARLLYWNAMQGWVNECS